MAKLDLYLCDTHGKYL